MRDPIADLKHELLAAAERQQEQHAAADAGGRRLRASLSRSRLVFTAATVAVAAAAALFVSSPWKTSPGFLEQVHAAITPRDGTVLHFKVVGTQNGAGGCTVTHPPIEYWVDLAPPHNYRGFEVQQPDICMPGYSIEIGGATANRKPTLMFQPPNTLTATWLAPNDPDLDLDPYGNLRQAIDDGTAQLEGRTVLNGRKVERIRQDCNHAKFPMCLDPIYVYVDPETFKPLRSLSGPGLRPGPGASCTAPCWIQDFVTYEYLPGTPENRALADIRAQHPDAIER